MTAQTPTAPATKADETPEQVIANVRIISNQMISAYGTPLSLDIARGIIEQLGEAGFEIVPKVQP